MKIVLYNFNYSGVVGFSFNISSSNSFRYEAELAEVTKPSLTKQQAAMAKRAYDLKKRREDERQQFVSSLE